MNQFLGQSFNNHLHDVLGHEVVIARFKRECKDANKF